MLPIGIILIVCVVGLWLLTARVRDARRLRQAAAAPDEDRCWLCGTAELEQVAPEAFRCPKCDNVQGSGAVAYRDAARRQGYAKLPEEKRRALAARLLDESRLELLAVEGELQQVLELSHADFHNADSDGGRDKLSRFAQALQMVTGVEQKLIDAALVLADPVQLQRLSVDLGTLNAVLDELDLRISWDLPGFSGSYSGFGEGRTHRDIERAIEHLPELQRLHQRLTAQLGAGEGR